MTRNLKIIDMPTVVLTIPSLGAQVLASPSGALVLAIPSGALVLKNISGLPDLLPALPAIAIPSAEKAAPNLRTSSEPYNSLVDRSACTLQLEGLRVPHRQCHCVIPCIRLKPLLRVVVSPPSPIGAELHLHAARAAGPGGAVIFRAKR